MKHASYDLWGKRLAMHAAKAMVVTTYRLGGLGQLQDMTHHRDPHGVWEGVCVMKGWGGPPRYHQDDFFLPGNGRPNPAIVAALE